MSSIISLLEPYKYVLWIWYIFEDQTLEATHNLLHTHYPEVELLQQNSQHASVYPQNKPYVVYFMNGIAAKGN